MIKKRKIFVLIFTASIFSFFICSLAFSQVSIPKVELSLGESDNPEDIVPALKILAILTLMALAPALLLMTTSFTRILIVLSFVRQAIGTQTMPPNQVIIGLTFFLTFFTMSPIFNKINDEALSPYIEKKITQKEALARTIEPLKQFMLKETRESDLALFVNMSGQTVPQNPSEINMTSVMPAFMISELKTAFQIGFLVFIPFLVIDMVVSSVLMAMGMMMLPPTIVSLPFKLILFVLVDGWSLIVSSLVRSFNVF